MKRKTKKNSPIWPYLGILACLFLLSLTAPRAWDRHRHRDAVVLVPRSVPQVSPAPPTGSPLFAIDEGELETHDTTELQPHAGELELGEPAAPEFVTAESEFFEPTEAIIPAVPEFANLVQDIDETFVSVADVGQHEADRLSGAKAPRAAALVEPSISKDAPAVVEQPTVAKPQEFPASGFQLPSFSDHDTQHHGKKHFADAVPPLMAPTFQAALPRRPVVSSPLDTPTATPQWKAVSPQGEAVEQNNLEASEDPPVAPIADVPAVRMIEARDEDSNIPAEEASERVNESQIATEDKPEAAASGVALPRRLLSQLLELSHEDTHLVWPRRASQLVQDFCKEEDARRQQEILRSLRELNEKDATLPTADASMVAQITRVRYSITRWLDVWGAVLDLQAAPVEIRTSTASTARLLASVNEFDAMAKKQSAGSPWREYLQLSRIQEVFGSEANAAERRELARLVLDRMASPRLTQTQREFLDTGSLKTMQNELKTWAVEPVDERQFLANLEAFEYSGASSDAKRVAESYRNFSWSSSESATRLEQHLDTHHRNANVRFAVSSELANHLIPQPERINSPVRDTVVNVPVRGHTSTFTELAIRFIPDPKRIRLGLEANGVVDASTISNAGPAKFRNKGQSTFLVRKLFVMGPRGLYVWPAIAEAENNYNYLVALETDYDGVPVVGSLVRNIARTQHDEMAGMARRQTEMKVATRALQQLDTEIQERLAAASAKFEANQAATLQRLGLDLVPISLQTTEQRVVGRMRLASPQQLGAHTPRPRAPSDSWFSLQLHQSALNNGIEQLDLAGRTFEVSELFAWIAEKLGRPELAQQEDLPEDVQITFAKKDPVQLVCVDNRIEVTLDLAELTHEGSRWRNFQVRTNYAPEADGLSPRFSRVDTIRLAGPSLRGKIEFKLRAIFSKVLSKNRDLYLLTDAVTNDPRFNILQMSQFSIEDGWIALAYSPRRVSSKVARTPSAEKQATGSPMIRGEIRSSR